MENLKRKTKSPQKYNEKPNSVQYFSMDTPRETDRQTDRWEISSLPSKAAGEPHPGNVTSMYMEVPLLMSS